MSRKFSSMVLIAVLLTMTIFTAVPAQAQDNEGEELAPCTAEELALLDTLITDVLQQFGAAAQTVTEPAAFEDFVNLALAYETVAGYLHTEVLPQMPTCIDGKYMSIVLTDTLDIASLTNALIAIGVSEAETDTEAADAYMALATTFADSLVESQDALTSSIASIKAGTAMEAWLPACTEEELTSESAAEYEAYFTTYFEEIEPAVNEDFNDDGALTNESLLLMAQSVDELDKLSDELSACEPIVSGAFVIYRIYLESAIMSAYMRLTAIAPDQSESITALSMGRFVWMNELFEQYRPVEEEAAAE